MDGSWPGSWEKHHNVWLASSRLHWPALPPVRLMSGIGFLALRGLDQIDKMDETSPKPAKLVAPASSARVGTT